MTEYQSKCLKVGNKVRDTKDNTVGTVTIHNDLRMAIKWDDGFTSGHRHDRQHHIEHLERIYSEQELTQMLANALATWYGCRGHNKAARNQSRYNELTKQMADLGYAIPSHAELLEMGQFNGEGSC